MSAPASPATSIVLRACSLLLSYPDDELARHLPVVAEVAGRLPTPAGTHLARFCAGVEQIEQSALAAEYVDTFDLRRRCCLYLTYYAFGDTRKRGMALLGFRHAYAAADAELAEGELPDHLAVVCEFAAAHPGAGLALLGEHRAALELLRIALDERGSRYRDVIDAIGAVLPEPAPSDLERALALIRSGPPAEEVGLEPFAPPEEMGARR